MKQRQNRPFVVDKFIASIIVVTIIILAAVVFLGYKIAPSVQIVPDKETKVQVEKTTHDWGDINMDDGKVETQFTIRSLGSNLLKLYDIRTSCMCTTAQLVTHKQTSPSFGMHSKSGYIFEIPNQESAQLKVVFDPAYHGPSGVGSITRQVEISTNDPQNSKLTFVLTANVSK